MRRSVVLTAVVALVASCGGGSAVESTTTAPASTTTVVESETSAPTTAAAEPTVITERDLVYHFGSPDEGWIPPLIDLYAPTSGDDLPVVVIFPGGAMPRKDPLPVYKALATELAEKGALVFVPNYETTTLPDDPGDARTLALREWDGAACAVSYAITRAADHGGDPSKLVLVGHSFGGNAAMMVGLRQPDPFPECAVDPVPFEADGIVTWEGDWLLLGSPIPEDYWGDDLRTVLDVLTPWAWIDTDVKASVDLVVTAGGRQVQRRCQWSGNEDWWVWRDPDGWFTERLQASGAFDDGCIDVGEPTMVLADTMREAGFDVEEISLESSSHERLSSADLETLVDATLAIVDRRATPSADDLARSLLTAAETLGYPWVWEPAAPDDAALPFEWCPSAPPIEIDEDTWRVAIAPPSSLGRGGRVLLNMAIIDVETGPAPVHEASTRFADIARQAQGCPGAVTPLAVGDEAFTIVYHPDPSAEIHDAVMVLRDGEILIVYATQFWAGEAPLWVIPDQRMWEKVLGLANPHN